MLVCCWQPLEFGCFHLLPLFRTTKDLKWYCRCWNVMNRFAHFITLLVSKNDGEEVIIIQNSNFISFFYS
jgi:hypothetical protein